MKFVYLLVCISIFCNVKAQKNDFLLEDFNNINSWQQDLKNFINNSENYILDTSTTYSSDYISKQIPKINLNEDSTVWKIDINTNFTNSSANYFEIFLVGNSLNTSDENFNGISIATGIFKPYNSLSLIKYNGENKEQIYCNQKKFTSSVVTVTRSKLGVWRINDEIIYSEEPIMEDLYSEFIIVKFKFNKTGAQKFSFKFIEFYQGSDIQEPEPEPEQYPQANFSEIVINEIMADINPAPNELPAKKYIELFNRSDTDFSLKDYTFTIGADELILPETILKSKSYIFLCANPSDFENSDNAVKFSSVNKLTVAGKYLALKNAEGQLIDSLTYSVSMYQDTEKEKGGYSLERIDSDNFCYQYYNFQASNDLSGGTPGKVNSVNKNNVDITPPKLITYYVINNYSFELEFSEDIKKGNFFLNEISAEEIQHEKNNFIVFFSNALKYGENILKYSISDFCDNNSDVQEIKIDYQKFCIEEKFPQSNQYEIVINEIMADISPKPFALPDKKYIELFNNSTIDYNIKNYKLIIGNDSIIFSDITLKSNDYIIISNEKSYSDYGNYFHSQITDKLTIAGKKIILKNADNQIIDSLTYSINLYNDENKNSGGFALERIDPENNCYQNNNWKASLDLSGGTPGRINSVYAINIDNSLPQILNYDIINNQTFKIEFSKPIFSIDAKLNKIKAETKDISAQKSIVQFPNSLTEGENILKISAMDFCKNTLEDTIFTINYTKFEVEKIYAINKNQVLINFSTKIQNAELKNFQLKNNSTQPIVVNITSDKKGVLLTFEENFVNKEKYELNIYNLKNTISDTLKINTYKFQYQKLEYQDIVINEILFNPKKGAKRFVELYNNSNNEILLYGLKFTNVLTEKSCIIDSMIFLQPKNYAVLTPDSLDIKNNYDCGKIFIQNKKFPTLNEKEGIITIQSIENTTLDSVYYSKNMHNKFLTSTDGVSLERVSFSDSFTWRSAAESSLFATPGKENSQKDFLDEILEDQTEEKIEITNTYTNEITIENQLFTPLNEDKMYTIHFNFKNQETTLNIYIYDTKGRLKRTLKKNFVVSRGDTVFWDGLDNDSNRCKTGIYIVLINALDQQGMSKNYKKVCVIGTNN